MQKLNARQKRALEVYKHQEQQFDRYMGSVFVTPAGQKAAEAKVTAAYEACVRLGMGVEHGL